MRRREPESVSHNEVDVAQGASRDVRKERLAARAVRERESLRRGGGEPSRPTVAPQVVAVAADLEAVRPPRDGADAQPELHELGHDRLDERRYWRSGSCRRSRPAPADLTSAGTAPLADARAVMRASR